MTTFNDGPAQGQTLLLKYSPHFLRVTELNGKWDALDEPKDQPLPEEKLHCYVHANHKGHAFLDGPNVSGCYPVCDYDYYPLSPTDEEMRDNAKWAQWCKENA